MAKNISSLPYWPHLLQEPVWSSVMTTLYNEMCDVKTGRWHAPLIFFEWVWMCNPFFVFFQALPPADTAHFLWHCRHGSAVCNCWLNMEEQAFCLTRHQNSEKSEKGAEKCCCPLPLHSCLRDFFLRYLWYQYLVTLKYLTKEWHFMTERKTDETFVWTLKNVPYSNNKGGFVWISVTKFVLLIRQSRCFAHGTPAVPAQSIEIMMCSQQNRYDQPCTKRPPPLQCIQT